MIIHLPDEGAGFDGVTDPDFLAVTNHTPSKIIADDDHNGQSFANGIFKLHEIKPDRAVPCNKQNPFFRISQFSGIGIGQSHGQGTKNAVVKVMAGLFHGAGHPHPRGGIPAISHDNIIVAVHEIINFTGQTHGMDGCICAFPVGLARCLSGGICPLKRGDPPGKLSF